MKHLFLVVLISMLPFVSGCANETTDELRYKYHLLKFNMTEDEIYQVIGTPDMKIPEVMGETWMWKDEGGMMRIAVYISPQMKWQVPKTDITPRLTIDIGRLIYKRWLNNLLVGAS